MLASGDSLKISAALCDHIMVAKFKKNPKIREKRGSGWVGHAPTRIFIIFCTFFCFVFFVLFSCSQMFQKKYIKSGMGGMGVSGLTNPSFSRIFFIFFNMTRPLSQ